MAGGSGTRFWPESRNSFPKQFLPFFENKSLIQMTVERMGDIVGKENVFIIMGKKHVPLFIKQVPDFPEENLILEPCARDTAAAVGLAAMVISLMRPGSVMIVAPADHLIDEIEKYRSVLENGCRIAKRSGCLLTIGIKPREASSAYGYIDAGEKISGTDGVDAFEVRAFKEKPDKITAMEYLRQDNYFWNSGIFIWETSSILEEISTHIPEMYGLLTEIAASFNSGHSLDVVEELFPQLPKTSIDYGVLEKSTRILTMKGDFYWDDLGSWNAYAGYLEKDTSNNSAQGNYIAEDCHGNIIISDSDNLVALSGVKDLIVVRSDDVTMVCDKKDDQAIKRLVNSLKNSDKFSKFI